MAIQLYVLKNGKSTLIPAGQFSWRSASGTLAQQLEFPALALDTLPAYFTLYEIGVGSIVSLYGNSEILRGIVVKESRTGEFERSYTCLDFGFYLGQSEGIYQFNKIAVKYAIGKILSDFGIKHNITNELFKVFVTKIYKDTVISEIIQDLLDLAFKETGKKYIMEMRGDIFFVIPDDDSLKITPKIRIAAGTPEVPALKTISNPSRELSIEDMKNVVIISSSDEDKADILAQVQNEDLIRQFGRLQEFQTVSGKDTAQAKNIAQNVLADLGRIMESNSFDVVGNEELRAYRRIEVDEPLTGIKGLFRITAAIHNYSDGIHKTTLQVEQI